MKPLKKPLWSFRVSVSLSLLDVCDSLETPFLVIFFILGKWKNKSQGLCGHRRNYCYKFHYLSATPLANAGAIDGVSCFVRFVFHVIYINNQRHIFACVFFFLIPVCAFATLDSGKVVVVSRFSCLCLGALSLAHLECEWGAPSNNVSLVGNSKNIRAAGKLHTCYRTSICVVMFVVGIGWASARYERLYSMVYSMIVCDWIWRRGIEH